MGNDKHLRQETRKVMQAQGRERSEQEGVQAAQDALNLTTLIRWAGRHGGSFKVYRDAGGKWGVQVLRRGDLISRGNDERLIVFFGSHKDLSTIVGRAADAVKRTVEWNNWVAPENRGDREKAFDWDAAKRGDFGSVAG